jgi:hypothetical protein
VAQRTQRAKASTDKEKIEAAAEAAPEVEAASTGTPPQNGVFVSRVIDENGNIGVDVQVVGDVKVTEAPTILALGRKLVDSKLEL